MRSSANLNIMIRSARRAGRSLVKDFREVENLQVSVKGAVDFAGRAGPAAEKIIRADLTAARPTYGWLGAAGEEEPGQDPTRRWIVAALAGAANFLHGLPHFAVSIALEHKGQIVAAVIHDPAKDELFLAEKGAGAWMNESRLRVSSRRRMGECLFAAGVAFAGGGAPPAGLDDFGRLAPVCGDLRLSGSAALDLAYVAAGRHDGFWGRDPNPQDIAAGLLLVTEAGGLAGPIRDGHEPLEHGDVIAANEPVFDQLARIVRDQPGAGGPTGDRRRWRV